MSSYRYSHVINITARNRYPASCLNFKFFAPKCGLRFNFAPLQGAAFIFSCLHSAYCVEYSVAKNWHYLCLEEYGQSHRQVKDVFKTSP